MPDTGHVLTTSFVPGATRSRGSFVGNCSCGWGTSPLSSAGLVLSAHNRHLDEQTEDQLRRDLRASGESTDSRS